MTETPAVEIRNLVKDFATSFRRKSLRAGHTIVDASGRAVGQVSSFAYVHEDMTFVVLACVEEKFRPKVGDVVTASVIRVEKKPRRIEISVRKHDRKEERRLLKQYRDSGEGVSLADVTGWGRPEETADKPGDATPP